MAMVVTLIHCSTSALKFYSLNYPARFDFMLKTLSKKACPNYMKIFELLLPKCWPAVLLKFSLYCSRRHITMTCSIE